MRKLPHDEIPRLTLEEARHSERHPVYVVLDNVRSAYNVGSIFRTCDGAGVAGLYLCGYTPHPPHKEIAKTALTAVDSVPWEFHPSIEKLLRELKARNVTIAPVEIARPSKPYTELDRRDYPVALVFGNEIVGVSPEVLELADFALEIPMYGIKQSLNVAVAAGIAVFEAIRVFKENRDYPGDR
ncbi:MAG: RNA methyltransferase [Chlorobi bacterium]|nr:RNA methyltransferase [Chlorobiota bacterium]